MQWSISGRSVALDVQGAACPEVWQGACAMHGSPPGPSMQEADIVIEAVPFVQAYEVAEAAVWSVYDAHRRTLRADVRFPSAEGTVERRGGGLRGRFEIVPDNIFGLHVALRACLAISVEEAGGVWLHASGIWRDGKVWLFCGPSGAGKSTIAHTLRGAGELFTEDEAFVEIDASGRPVAAAAPMGDPRVRRSCPTVGPLAGVAFITQASETAIAPLSVHRAVSHLLRDSRWCPRDPISTQRILDNIDRVFRTGRCFELKFTKDAILWPLLEEVERWHRS